MADKYAELIKTGLIDEPIFSQNLEMDDDQVVRDFSFELVNEFFQQAREKFVEMDEALETKDLGLLRDIGHFLKGSSSGIGFTQLQETFGKIDNIGKGLDERGQFSSESEETRLGLIAKLLRIAKAQYNAVAVPVQRFYGVDRFDEEARTPVPVGSAACEMPDENLQGSGEAVESVVQHEGANDGEHDERFGEAASEQRLVHGATEQTWPMEDLIYAVEIVNYPQPGSADPEVMALWAGLFWQGDTGSIKLGFEWARFSVGQGVDVHANDTAGNEV